MVADVDRYSAYESPSARPARPCTPAGVAPGLLARPAPMGAAPHTSDTRPVRETNLYRPPPAAVVSEPAYSVKLSRRRNWPSAGTATPVMARLWTWVEEEGMKGLL